MPSDTSSPAGQAFFDRIPTNGDNQADKCKVLYDEWARTYDQDLTDASQGYVGPENTAKAVLGVVGPSTQDRPLTVLDAGCGTGLSGVAVRKTLGSTTTIDGIDISRGMLDVAAKTGAYRKLEIANLAESIGLSSASYDVIVCVGTLTGGHVGPVPALGEFARLCKLGGVIAATVKESVWSSGGYEAEVQRLVGQGIVRLHSTQSTPYRQGQGVNAIMLVLEKI